MRLCIIIGILVISVTAAHGLSLRPPPDFEFTDGIADPSSRICRKGILIKSHLSHGPPSIHIACGSSRWKRSVQRRIFMADKRLRIRAISMMREPVCRVGQRGKTTWTGGWWIEGRILGAEQWS